MGQVITVPRSTTIIMDRPSNTIVNPARYTACPCSGGAWRHEQQLHYLHLVTWHQRHGHGAVSLLRQPTHNEEPQPRNQSHQFAPHTLRHGYFLHMWSLVEAWWRLVPPLGPLLRTTGGNSSRGYDESNRS
jgi:hypothetical protein